MADALFSLLREYFAAYGYLTLMVILLLENAGIPLPGETSLLFAAFLAYSEHRLKLQWIIVTGVIACTIGDNLGYWIGARGGRPLLLRHQRFFRISDRTIRRGEELFRRHGALTVFFARFIFGLRIIAGPLAGVLRMPWRSFLLFNLLGALLWVSTIAVAGFAFGSQWERLTEFLGEANFVIVGLAILAVLAYSLRRHFREAH
jgi:membrane protein DedA with SNARE-associated domain